jgi:recombination protein RecA
MEYKLLPRFRGEFSVEEEFASTTPRMTPARILDIHVKPPTRSMNRFDIEVEGCHNYFVDGVMVHNSPETTSGGKALKFYASIRLDIRRIETLKEGTDAVGNRTRVKVVKNKMSPPFKVAEFDIIYGIGISREGSLIDLGVEQGIVRKSGAWYTYNGDQLGQGKENARSFLRENPDLANEIEKQIKEKLGIGPRLDAEVAAPPSNGNGNGNGNGSAGRGNGSGPRAAAVAPAVTV